MSLQASAENTIRRWNDQPGNVFLLAQGYTILWTKGGNSTGLQKLSATGKDCKSWPKGKSKGFHGVSPVDSVTN